VEVCEAQNRSAGHYVTAAQYTYPQSVSSS